jgi:hypothetical protein
MVALADEVDDSAMALSDLNISPSQDGQLGSEQTATEQDRYPSNVSDAA